MTESKTETAGGFMFRLAYAGELPETLSACELARLMSEGASDLDYLKLAGKIADACARGELPGRHVPEPFGRVQWKTVHGWHECTYWAVQRADVARWLKAPPEGALAAWLGDAWPVAAAQSQSNTRASKASNASESQQEERRAYLRAIWLEMGEPAKNQGIWNALRKKAGTDGCPILAVAGNDEFTFRYDDGRTEPLTKKTFQNDMTEIRRS